MAKLLAKWHITGSKDERHIVTLDRDGNYECSCLSEQCRHIQAIRNRQEFVKKMKNKAASIVEQKVPCKPENQQESVKDMPADLQKYGIRRIRI